MEYQKKPVNIKGYEMYQCDTEGIVYGKNGKPLKPNVNQHGYKYVVFCVNGKTKTFQVHRIIALTFVPNPENLPIVNHLDGNKLNVKADNFEWTTNQGNMIHARDVLGYFVGEANNNAKAIQGFDKKTGELKYDFPSLADAARYFTPIGKDYRCYVQMIWRTMGNSQHRKSYKGCIWKYKQ